MKRAYYNKKRSSQSTFTFTPLTIWQLSSETHTRQIMYAVCVRLGMRRPYVLLFSW